MIKISNSAKETQKFAKDFLRKILKKNERPERAIVVGLEGELGSGKTTFVQGLAQGLNIKEKVNSPTFMIIKKYNIRNTVIARSEATKQSRGIDTGLPRSPNGSLAMTSFYHIDCYRLEKPWQIQELDFEKIISEPKNIVVIEWAEKIKDILPKDIIWLKFEWQEKNKRKIYEKTAFN